MTCTRRNRTNGNNTTNHSNISRQENQQEPGEHNNESSSKTNPMMSENKPSDERDRALLVQQETINELLKKVTKLEEKIEAMESEISVVKTVNSKLSADLKRSKLKIEAGEQYSRRPCVIVTGCQEPGFESNDEEENDKIIGKVAEEVGLNKEIVKNNVDKIHPVGEPKNGKQARIIKFTTHSFKEKVFIRHRQSKKREREQQKKNPQTKRTITLNLQPSLTRYRLGLLKKANEMIENHEYIKFAYADMHGTLKFVLHEPINRKYVHEFETIQDVEDMISYFYEE